MTMVAQRQTRTVTVTLAVAVSMAGPMATGAAGCRRERAKPLASSPARTPLVLSVVNVRSVFDPGGAGPGGGRGGAGAQPDREGILTLDDRALERLIARRFESSGLVKTSGLHAGGAAGSATATAAAAQLRIGASVVAEWIEVRPKAKVRASVAVQLDTRPSDVPGALADRLAGSGERDLVVDATTDPAALAQEIAERTLADLLDGFLASARLQIADDRELHALLVNDGGGPLREEAIRQVGVRGRRDEAPALLQLLHDETESVRDAALGALLLMREPRAVRELTRSRSMKDRREMRKILDALATLGGNEALEYLNFVAEGHSDGEIRSMATEARDRLVRRVDSGR